MSNQTSTSQQMKSFLSGKTYLLLIIIIFNGLLVQQTFAQPTITSFTPADGPVGTEVTITGTHFSSIAANNIVYFGAVKSTVIAATATTLKVNVPTGTTYQPITVTTKGLTAYSSKPFLVTFASVAGPFTDSSFSANIDFETGISPLDNHLSDFNGDGKPDVIVSDYNAPTVTILKNLSTNGNVTFDSVVNLKTSGNATTCFIGDFDGDGKQDVGATGYFTNSISVFRNQSSVGNISFGSKTDFATSVGPSYSAIGDLDKDGKPDIVITARGSERISILRNTSTTANISFASKLDFTIGANSEPFACAMGDLDGDGKVDIIVGNRGVGYISLFRNTSTPGHISLASRVDINISEDKTPNGISIGDLNGDGEPDIVVAGFGNNFAPAWISILQNKSIIGSLLFEKHIDFFTGGAGCHSASITDLDGDGKPDLVTDNYWDGILSVLKNTSTSGHLSFDKPVFLKANSGPNHPQISDLDGDQKPDIEVANIFSHSVSAFRNLIKFKRSSLVSSFTLVNANTDKDIQAIPDGSVLDKTALPPLNIRANTTATKVGSVVFILDGQKVRTENGFPYALAGDFPVGDYLAWSLPLGDHTLTAIPYSDHDSKGTQGRSLTIHFTVIGPRVNTFTLVNANTDKDIQAIPDGSVLDKTALPPNLNIRANTTATKVGSVVFILDGQKVRTENGFPYALAGDFPVGDYHAWSLPLGDHTLTAIPYSNRDGKGAQGTSLTIHFTVIGSRVNTFTLVNANTDKDIEPVPDESILIKTGLPPNLNIRANTTPTKVGSVVFILDGQKVRTESGFPYALAGDFPVGDYLAWSLPLGDHTLTAIPYSNHNGTGFQGASLTINFTVTAPQVKYCNGVAYDPDRQGCCVGVIYNIYEQKCTSCGIIYWYEKCAPPCGIISIEQSCCPADSTPYATNAQDCTACGVSGGSGVEKCTPCGYVPLDQPLECCEALLTVYDTLKQKCTPCGIIPIDQNCDQLVSKAATNKPNFVDKAAGVKLSPNPVQNTLHISINGRQNKTTELYILSASGVVIKNIHSVTSTDVRLDVSSLINGVYFIKVISGDKVMYKQFVKL